MTTQTQQNKLDSVSTIYSGLIILSVDVITAKQTNKQKKTYKVIKGGDKKRQNTIQFQTNQFLLRLPENLLVGHNIVVFIKCMKQQELITLSSSTHQRPRLLNRISFLKFELKITTNKSNFDLVNLIIAPASKSFLLTRAGFFLGY